VVAVEFCTMSTAMVVARCSCTPVEGSSIVRNACGVGDGCACLVAVVALKNWDVEEVLVLSDKQERATIAERNVSAKVPYAIRKADARIGYSLVERGRPSCECFLSLGGQPGCP
jgi:hypothetical protein